MFSLKQVVVFVIAAFLFGAILGLNLYEPAVPAAVAAEPEVVVKTEIRTVYQFVPQMQVREKPVREEYIVEKVVGACAVVPVDVFEPTEEIVETVVTHTNKPVTIAPTITNTPEPPPVVVITTPEPTKRNCGVGNGVDGDTKGCPEGANDGPGHGPGNPGRKGGNH